MSPFDRKLTPPNITQLSNNEIFVFGSNLSGIHGGGAALLARKWGAIMGEGVGLQGKTYAIPTKSEGITRSLTPDEIYPYVEEFIRFATVKKSYTFLVTEIGCGLAGHRVEDIAWMFRDAMGLANVRLPERFWNYLLEY